MGKLNKEDQIAIHQLFNLIPRCDTCSIDLKHTPQARSAKHSRPYTSKPISLCNKHGLRYQKGKFCPNCFCVYKKKDYQNNKNVFVLCDRCLHVNEDFYSK